MHRVTLKIKIKIKAPFLSQSSEIGAFGVDAVLARDGNSYCIPRKLIKGCLRQAWRELRDVQGDNFLSEDELERWLGKKPDDSDYKPYRGLIHFNNFIADPRNETSSLFRIRINDERRAVDKGAYQVIEAPFKAGEVIEFDGGINFIASETEAKKIKGCIMRGLRWITNLGALGNVGFGKVEKVELKEDHTENINIHPSTRSDSPEFLDICINPQSPFCAARKRLNENLFESDSSISGAILKGAFAETWLAFKDKRGAIDENTDKDRHELGKYFESIRFTHAFPAPANSNKRPVKLPFSLVKAGKKVYDIALCEGAGLFKDDNGKFIAPSFFVDWKDSRCIEKEFGWTDLSDKTKLEVHTAIENNRAKDNSLYAYELIVPNELDWYARVDLSTIQNQDERRKVAEQLASLLESLGLHNIGKTKAQAKVSVLKTEITPFIQSKPVPGFWIVTLQSPALLCNPAKLDEMSGAKQLEDAYKKIWERISANTLTMERFFASQSLAGGKYLHNRFQKGKLYNPYLLTEAGSVFVLKAQNGKAEDAQQKIEEWKKTGLPLPQWAKTEYARDGKPGDHWSNCPYIPQNGYGEIAVNLAVHTDKQARGGEFDVIKW